MGPAYGRDPRDARRRSRFGSLATLPRVAFRPPPLTPAPPAERLRSMASRSRHRSAVVAGRDLSLRVVERRRATLPMRRSPWVASPRRRLNRRSPARARVASATGSSRAGKIWIPLHGIILPACDGVANRSEVAPANGQKRGPGRPLRPGQMLSRPARFGSPAPCAQAPRTPASPSLSRAA